MSGSFESANMAQGPRELAELSIHFSRYGGRIMVLWVDDTNPSNVEFVWEQRRPISSHLRDAAPPEPNASPSPEDTASSSGSAANGQVSDTVMSDAGTSATSEEDADTVMYDAGTSETSAEDDDNGAEPEFFWPNIQRYIECGSASGPRPSLKCAICLQGLFHPGICSPNARHRLEPVEVLDCGHVVGRRCWGTMVIHAVAERKSPCCPFCRTKQRTWFWSFGIGEAGQYQSR